MAPGQSWAVATATTMATVSGDQCSPNVAPHGMQCRNGRPSSPWTTSMVSSGGATPTQPHPQRWVPGSSRTRHCGQWVSTSAAGSGVIVVSVVVGIVGVVDLGEQGEHLGDGRGPLVGLGGAGRWSLLGLVPAAPGDPG